MLKKIGLRFKIMAGSGAPLLLMVALSVASAISIKTLLDASYWVDHTHTVIREAMKVEAAAVDMETGMRGYLLAGKEEFLTPYKNGKKRFVEITDNLKETVKDEPGQVELLTKIQKTIKSWQTEVTEPAIQLRREVKDVQTIVNGVPEGKTMNDVANLIKEARGKVFFDRFREQIKTFREHEETLMTARKESAKSTATSTTNLIYIGTLIVLFSSMCVAYFLTSSIQGPLKEIFGGLTSFSSKELEDTKGIFRRILGSLTTGSNQVNNASEQMASGANQQASSLEEISSSIEELSSMTKQSADNAQEANSLAQESRSTAERGEGEIKNLIGAMHEISQGSKKIEEIIEVIDDISFQTNLLALNAAVEAARAGEQGKGFAVVAEAVRNLALRSANSAKDIATLIMESASQSEKGVKVADQSGQVLNEIVTQAKKVSDLVGEVSSASQEQASSLSMISKAINDLDQVTQANAMVAEKLSNSSKDLAGQTGELETLVGSSQRDGGHSEPVAEVEELQQPQLVKPMPSNHANASSAAAQVIPFGDEEEEAPKKVANLSDF